MNKKITTGGVGISATNAAVAKLEVCNPYSPNGGISGPPCGPNRIR
ncbi:MAG: hypothetical protein M3044_07485 [Thermoproteota archaeon]|nr:hypothetical protein [Thermoproteota archaeon]